MKEIEWKKSDSKEELREKIDELNDALEKRHNEANTWCQKAMESANTRIKLQSQLQSLEAENKRLKEDVEAWKESNRYC